MCLFGACPAAVEFMNNCRDDNSGFGSMNEGSLGENERGLGRF